MSEQFENKDFYKRVANFLLDNLCNYESPNYCIKLFLRANYTKEELLHLEFDSQDLDNVIEEYVKEELDDIKESLDTGGQLSYWQISFLQAHHEEIKKYYPNDADLYLWANIPEEEFGK